MNQPMESAGQSISTARLVAVLQDEIRQKLGSQRRIAGLKRRPSLYRSSFALEEIDVHLDDGSVLLLIFKDLSWRGLTTNGHPVKPMFFHDPLREIETYQIILAQEQLGTAACYGVIIDPEEQLYGLLLEKVRGVELYQVGEFGWWQQVASWLAGMHNRFARKADLLAKATHLIRYDSNFYDLWLGQARAFLQRGGSALEADAQDLLECLASSHEKVVRRLASLPATFIHGDFFPSNILVEETGGSLRVSPVDWEMAAVAPGLIDLAALIAGKWTDGQKTALALTYHDALVDEGVWSPTTEEFLAALDYCRLHLAVRMLGWLLNWSPPVEHQQNWLVEALQLVKKTGS